jgi:hypothetical protein
MHRADDKPAEAGGTWITWDNGISLLQRLVTYDYLVVHSGDVPGGPTSLHPAVPFRGSEWIVKRGLVSAGLKLMFARELVSKQMNSTGISYLSSDLTRPFVELLQSQYAHALRTRTKWVFEEFGSINDDELGHYMTSNVGRWGAEFEHLTALRDLQL